MSITININNLTLCHKESGGVSMATVPDVCKTPSPGGPVPIPYPNIAYSTNIAGGTTTVKADGGNMCANYGSQFSTSIGDEAGTLGGVKSGTYMKEATWITYSFDVTLEGKGACRLADKLFHNHQNTVNMGGLLQPTLEMAAREGGKAHPPTFRRTGSSRAISPCGFRTRCGVRSTSRCATTGREMQRML